MKSGIYGAILGFFIPLILMATDYLPMQEGNELRTIIASVVLGFTIGALLRLAEYLYAKAKQKQ